jgi:nucleoside-diphosphate-sugar epimerase
MSADGVHVVFGAGQVGRTLSAKLIELGVEVRVVSRSRPDSLVAGVQWRPADASDFAAASEAAKDASVIYQCLNAPYAKWPERFPPLQRSLLEAAERHGALLVTLENVYGYGSTAGKPMTEDLPLAATSVKGRTRAVMTDELLGASEAGRVRIAIGRAADFFGAGVTETTLGERVFANALEGKRADFLGDPELPHSYSYVPDVAVGLARLGTDERAVGGVWHLPVPETLSTAQILEIVAEEVGHPVASRSVPKVLLRALGLFNPVIRELPEIAYQVEEPFVLDTTKYRSVFGDPSTPLTESIAATVDWYRGRAGMPAPRPEEAIA